MQYLSSMRPPDPAAGATGDYALVSSSDDYGKYKDVFARAAAQPILSKQCTRGDFEETGGWLKSTAHKDSSVYFTYCGGFTRENRLYLNAGTREPVQIAVDPKDAVPQRRFSYLRPRCFCPAAHSKEQPWRCARPLQAIRIRIMSSPPLVGGVKDPFLTSAENGARKSGTLFHRRCWPFPKHRSRRRSRTRFAIHAARERSAELGMPAISLRSRSRSRSRRVMRRHGASAN